MPRFADRTFLPNRRTIGRPRLGVALAAALALSPTACKPTNRFAAPPPPKVVVATPVAQTITRYILSTGNTAPVNQVDLVARVSGFLQDINYRDGAAVKKNDVLFTVEPRVYLAKLHQAQAAQVSAEAQLKQSESEYQRQLQLGQRDFASRSVVETALATRDSNQAAVQQAQASTEQAAIQYTYTQVTAPFDGIATAHLQSVGEYVGGTTPTKLASVVQVEPIWVNFNLSELDVLHVREVMRQRGIKIDPVGTVPVEIGLQNETGYPHQGVIDYVAPAVDPSTGTLAVRGVFKNEDRTLLSGYFVRVRVPVQSDVPALLVPDLALGTDQLGRYLLMVNDRNVVEQRRVTVGDQVGALREITGGLQAADRVVVAGIQRAVAGQTVTVETAQAAGLAPSMPQATPSAPAAAPRR